MTTTNLTLIQQKLAYAFKWMAKATKDSQQGDFASAALDMTYALQYWVECQHDKDRYVEDKIAEKLDWKFFTAKALAMAKKELQDEE